MDTENQANRDRVLSDYLLEQSDEALVLLDESGAVVAVNRAAREILPGVDLLRLLDGERSRRGELDSFCARLRSAGRAQAELFFRAPDGDARCLLVQGFAVQRHFALTLRDGRDRIALDDELRQLRRAHSAAVLTLGVAHDFNNMLMPIMHLSARLADGRAEAEGNVRKTARDLADAAQRAAGLARQLLGFARRGPARVERVNLNDVLLEIRALAERLAGDRVSLAIAADESLGDVMVDRERLEQTMVNLIANARDAMPNGGAVNIQTENVALEPPPSGVRGPSAGGPYVRISVADTGTGIAPEIRERVFEQFFTTKEPGHGTGLGLAAARRFVVESGGFVTMQSEEGVGTTVTIYLPRV